MRSLATTLRDLSAVASAPVITFLSDYGLRDDFVGICHGVIASICPQARVIDLTHGVRRHDVRQGAVILSEALPYMPTGVVLAVVDPGVGAQRRAVAVRVADQRLLVGPDNGLLSLAAAAGGGIVEAVDIARSPVRRHPVSLTFHGRDIFAPVAATLACGELLTALGEPLDPAELETLELAAAVHEDGALVVHVRYIDGFGNVALNAGHEEVTGLGLTFGRPVELELASGARHAVQFVRTFADVTAGELMLYEDAQRRLAVAVSHGDASAQLGLAVDDQLRIRP
ncbi:MAG: S-adenosyl-l-methionine hydroxide adenosyltransferase family protein [Solirubrobacteraceae bacterium]